MFSLKQKRDIADKIQNILRETEHPELPSGEIQFSIHVSGEEAWSWADIRNNGAVTNPGVNPWNERRKCKVCGAETRQLMGLDGKYICRKCWREEFIDGEEQEE